MATLPLFSTDTTGVYQSIRQYALGVRNNCTVVTAAAASGSVTYDQLQALLRAAQSFSNFMGTITSNAPLVTALTSYMQNQAAQPTLNVSGLAGAMITATTALIAAIVSDYPRTATVMQDHTMDGSGNIAALTTTSAGLASTLPAISAWLATVS